MAKDKIDQLIAEINKKYKSNVLMRANSVKYSEIQRLPSGSLFLDLMLGKNKKDESGWPLGRVVELYGPEMAGKSSLMMKTVVEAQKRGKICAWFDIEKSFEQKRAEQLGVDTSKLFLNQGEIDEEGTPATGERIIETICDLLKTGEVDLIVVDSLTSLVPQAELDKSMEESNRMALVAQMLSQGMRKITALNKGNCLVVFINQLRTNPGQTYGNPEYTPGGKALKYYSSIRLELRTGEWIIENKQKIGQLVKFRVIKNKTGKPHGQGTFQFMYDGEIDQIDEIISVGELEGSIIRKGSYFYLDSETGFQGREALYKALKNDTELFEKAKEIVFKVKNEK